MSRFRLAFRYAVGSRLDEYAKIVAAALKRGYVVCSVEQSLEELRKGTERLFVLRHDVDQISPGVALMAALESRLGVSSSYYFRSSTLRANDVSCAKRCGHEVSFHYETVADYAVEHDISDRVTLEGAGHFEQCALRLERDLHWFRSEASVPCKTLASHGAPRNRDLGVSNRVLFETVPKLHERLGVELETYDQGYLGQFDCYISDTQWEINDGFRYGRHPLSAIASRIPRIIMLTHPNHWAFTHRTRLRRLVKCLLLGRGTDRSAFAEAERLRRRVPAGADPL